MRSEETMSHTTRILTALALCALSSCASQPPEATVSCEAREQQFVGERKRGDLAGASVIFASLTAECPNSLTGSLRDKVEEFVHEMASDPQLDESRYRIMGRLFATGWTARHGTEPNYLWLDLAQRHLEHQNASAARKVAKKIFEPAALLQMRVDQRFDSVVSADRTHFDVAAAIERKVARLHAEAAASPRSTDAWMQYAYALQGAGRYEEALTFANDAIARGPTAFDEYAKLYPWILTTKGWALLSLQQLDEAIATLEAAEQYDAGAHVSFSINLGVAQERAGRSDAALATFAKIGRTSDYGGLALQLGIAGASRQKGDLPRAEEAMQKAHAARWSNVQAYTLALVQAGKMHEARNLLLQRLRDPNWRGQALADVQKYKRRPPLPAEGEQRARFDELVSHPDVQRVILEIGRIETFDFPQP
jgi:tetratricopeptide (TPR) repeat protein